MIILVLNSGSSSIKYQLFDMAKRAVLALGLVERIGEEHARLHLALPGHHNPDECMIEQRVRDHHEGMEQLLAMLVESGTITGLERIKAVGHRVVHGGERFKEPVVIDDAVKGAIKELISLAPLHNPANLEGIEIAQLKIPHAAQVAVFDTAFHQSIPDYAYFYALPLHLYERYGIRRYGFHGTSHAYVAAEAAEYLRRERRSLNMITLHLGNGASACAVSGGESVDTSMGFTPLEGLVMGTRSGDVDPSIMQYLEREAAMSYEDVDRMLNKESGLLGICGKNDMRAIFASAESGDAHALLALKMFAYRVKKYIGAYTAVLGRLDAIVFTGGIGEHSALMREMICEGLYAGLGIEIEKGITSCDEAVTPLQSARSKVAILAVKTDEELSIAMQTQALLA